MNSLSRFTELSIKVDRNTATTAEREEYERMLAEIVEEALKDTAMPMSADEFRQWIQLT